MACRRHQRSACDTCRRWAEDLRRKGESYSAIEILTGVALLDATVGLVDASIDAFDRTVDWLFDW